MQKKILINSKRLAENEKTRKIYINPDLTKKNKKKDSERAKIYERENTNKLLEIKPLKDRQEINKNITTSKYKKQIMKRMGVKLTNNDKQQAGKEIIRIYQGQDENGKGCMEKIEEEKTEVGKRSRIRKRKKMQSTKNEFHEHARWGEKGKMGRITRNTKRK